MMLIPARLKLILGLSVSVLALLAPPGIGRAHGQMSPEDAIKLIKSLPPGTPVEIQQSSSTEKATADGPSGTAVGDQAKLGIDGSAPKSETSKTKSEGGSVKATAEAEITHTVWWQIGLGLLSLCCFGAGAFFLWRTPPQVKDAAYCAAAGVGFAIAAIWPVFALFVLLAVAIGAVVMYALKAHGSGTMVRAVNAAENELAKTESAYHAVVDGLALAGPSAIPVVESVKKQASPEDKQHIETTAAANGNPLAL